MKRLGKATLVTVLIIGLNQQVRLLAIQAEVKPNKPPIVVDPEVINQSPGTDDEKEPIMENMPICAPESTFKSWMDYLRITSKSSRQWKLQQTATTDEYGFRRVGEYYMVAMAKQYGPVGKKYQITFSSGEWIMAIIGDIKGGTTCQHDDSSMVEFILDVNLISSVIRRSGNVDKVFKGTIISIRVVPGD